jgi:uncharacterized protein
MENIIYIKEILQKELSSSSHDLEHTMRVYTLALKIAGTLKGVNIEVIQLAALLHDIARVREDTDETHNIDHAIMGAEMASKILKEIGYEDRLIDHVAHCIRAHRFRGGEEPKTIEAKILSDADKLDAIGAIGVARAFMIAGEYGEPLYKEFDSNQYRDNSSKSGKIKNFKAHSPNIEFEMKLKLIPSRLYTDEAKRIAEERVKVMENFFNRLERDVRGEA